jgi:hypothetical protein
MFAEGVISPIPSGKPNPKGKNPGPTPGGKTASKTLLVIAVLKSFFL